MATLHELQTVYSMEDAFTLLDCLKAKNYNDYLFALTREQRK
jgi:hypothetical protein